MLRAMSLYRSSKIDVEEVRQLALSLNRLCLCCWICSRWRFFSRKQIFGGVSICESGSLPLARFVISSEAKGDGFMSSFVFVQYAICFLSATSSYDLARVCTDAFGPSFRRFISCFETPRGLFENVCELNVFI